MKRFLILGSSCALLSLSACLSAQNQPALDAVQNATDADGAHPYVEAFVEYRGPQQKWAGPATFVLHVVAKDAGVARVTYSPALRDAPKPEIPKHHENLDGTTSVRSLASVAGGMPGETARDQLRGLAMLLQGADPAYSGCLSPVKVRLIRADGAVMEKQGCRGQTGWPKAASEAVAQFMSVATTAN